MSKTITINVPHELGAAGARRRLDEGLAKLGSKLPGGLGELHQSWAGDVLSFSALVMGQTIRGRLEVLETVVKMDIDLPGLLGMMAGRIKSEVQKEGQLLLEKK